MRLQVAVCRIEENFGELNVSALPSTLPTVRLPSSLRCNWLLDWGEIRPASLSMGAG